jgi:N-acetylmuramoyl-L-alanine amidase
MKLEQDYQTTYEGFDPNSVDSYIMFELMQNKYIDQSLQFATCVQPNFSNNQQLNDRGGRQAAFWVLHKSACPSVLIEMGFISNKEEEKYMASDKGKREITNAIFTAFKQYYNAVKQPDKQKQVQAPDTLPMPKQKTTEPAKQNKNKQNTTPQKQTTIKQQSKASAQSTVYRVQIFSSRKLLKETDKEFKGLKGCIHRQRGEWYRYLYGEYSTQEQAQKKCEELKKLFPGCFVAEDEK